MKENDVFKFYYNKEYREKIAYPNHCFDGQLIAKERDGELFLVDTYWGFGFNQSSRVFTLENAKEKGELTFVCNLDEVEGINKNELNYYDDKDLFDLSYQHNCYKAYFKKKDAKKSTKKITKVIKNKIDKNKREIKWAKREIERLEEKLQRVENGNTDIYI